GTAVTSVPVRSSAAWRPAPSSAARSHGLTTMAAARTITGAIMAAPTPTATAGVSGSRRHTAGGGTASVADDLFIWLSGSCEFGCRTGPPVRQPAFVQGNKFVGLLGQTN